MNENIFERYVEWFTSQEFYIDYMSNFPEPLNNPTFASAVVLIAAFMLLTTIIGHINSWHFHNKIKKKNRELEEMKMNQRIEDTKREQERKLQREAERDADRADMKDMMSQYMEFMTMIHTQNAMGQMMSLRNMTFDQWQMQMYKQQANTVIETPSLKEIDIKYNTDTITGLLNRNAYERDIQEIDISKLGIVTIDANNLKKLNDTEGHNAGDKLLKYIADAIISVWGKDKSYRTGGDEFVIITEGVKEKITRKNMETFRELVIDDGYSAAVGYADASSIKGKVTIEKIQKASDRDMYIDKKAYKKALEDKYAKKQITKQTEELDVKEEVKEEEPEALRLENEKRIAEEARIEAEKIEFARIEAEKKQKEEIEREEKRKAEIQKKEEEARLAEEVRKQEEERKEAKRRAEAEEKRLEEERRIAEEKALTERLDETQHIQDELERQIKEQERVNDMAISSILEQLSSNDNEDIEDKVEEEVEKREETESYKTTILDEIETNTNKFTDEQESDFARLVAMMAADEKQKSQLSSYNQQKTEVTQKRIKDLDNQFTSGMENKINDKTIYEVTNDDALEKQKKEALARIEAEKNQPKKKGFKLFKK